MLQEPRRVRSGWLAVALLPLLGLSACTCHPATVTEQPVEVPAVDAVHTNTPIQVDGALNEAVWQRSPRYALARGRDWIKIRPGYKAQGGFAQFVWDDKHLYIAARLQDQDVVTQGTQNNQMHFQLGDTFEIYLTSIERGPFWEMYATPNGLQTTMRFEATGRRGLKGNRRMLKPVLSVAAHVNGTLNDDSDRDRGWTVEIAIPIAQITNGATKRLRPGRHWRILIGRYNYGRYLIHLGPELTMCPQLSRTDFHMLREYATLDLDPAVNQRHR